MKKYNSIISALIYLNENLTDMIIEQESEKADFLLVSHLLDLKTKLVEKIILIAEQEKKTKRRFKQKRLKGESL